MWSTIIGNVVLQLWVLESDVQFGRIDTEGVLDPRYPVEPLNGMAAFLISLLLLVLHTGAHRQLLPDRLSTWHRDDDPAEPVGRVEGFTCALTVIGVAVFKLLNVDVEAVVPVTFTTNVTRAVTVDVWRKIDDPFIASRFDWSDTVADASRAAAAYCALFLFGVAWIRADERIREKRRRAVHV